MERQFGYSPKPHADRDVDWLTLWPRYPELGFGLVNASGVSFAGREVVVQPHESIRLPVSVAAEVVRRSGGYLSVPSGHIRPLYPFQIKVAMTCP